MNKDIYMLLIALKEIDARLYLEKGKLKLDVKEGTLSDKLSQQIIIFRDEIIEFIKTQDSETNREELSLIKLNSVSDKKHSVVLIPPVTGNSIVFMSFAQHVSKELNCFGLDYHRYHNFETISELSISFSNAIRNTFSVDDHIIIAGYSMGATIAFEVIKELEKVQYKCELVLIDRQPNESLHLKSSDDELKSEAEIYAKHYTKLIGAKSDSAEVQVFKSTIYRNSKILEDHLTEGMVSCDISCIYASEDPDSVLLSNPMERWSKYTTGKLNYEKLLTNHYQIFDDSNYGKIANVIRDRFIEKVNTSL